MRQEETEEGSKIMTKGEEKTTEMNLGFVGWYSKSKLVIPTGEPVPTESRFFFRDQTTIYFLAPACS